MKKALPGVLQDRPTSGDVFRKLLPTRGRIALAVYDHAGSQNYRMVPGLALTLSLFTVREARRLWGDIRRVVEDGAWKDPDVRRVESAARDSARVGESPAGAPLRARQEVSHG